MRRVLLSADWDETTGVVIQEDFAVTNVKSILLSLGKLLKKKVGIWKGYLKRT